MAKHQDRQVVSSHLGSHCLSEREGIRFTSMGEEGRREAATAPSAKSGHADSVTYLERVTVHFAVLCVHVADAAMPTQGCPFATPGEAF